MSEDGVTIVVVGDAHVCIFEKVAEEIIQAVENADWVIHVGDYARRDALEGFRHLKKDRFRGVCANMDPMKG